MIARTKSAPRAASPAHVVLRQLPVVFGHSPDAGVQLHDGSAAFFHCTLEEFHHQVRVRDLGSLAGTRLNGALVRESLVRPGDELTVGDSTFRVLYDDADHARNRVLLEYVADAVP